MKKFWKKSAASLMAFSLLMGNNYAIHALDGESPDTGETPPAPESDPGYTIHGTLMSGETAIGDPVTINAADYTEQKSSGEAAPAVEGYSFDNAYITREGNSDVVVSFGSASYVTDAGTEVSYVDVSNDEHVVETVFSYTKNEETPAPAGEEPTPEPAAEETEKPADTEQEEDPAKSEIIKVKLDAKKNAPLLRSSNALEVSVGLYDYDDAGTLAFPSDFGGSEKVYAVVWVGDSSDISAAATDTPWAVVDITDIKEKNSPYTFDVGSFDTSPWGGGQVSYSSLTDAQKTKLRVRVIHTNESNISLGGLQNMAQYQRPTFEEIWNGGFEGYDLSKQHNSGCAPSQGCVA